MLENTADTDRTAHTDPADHTDHASAAGTTVCADQADHADHADYSSPQIRRALALAITPWVHAARWYRGSPQELQIREAIWLAREPARTAQTACPTPVATPAPVTSPAPMANTGHSATASAAPPDAGGRDLLWLLVAAGEVVYNVPVVVDSARLLAACPQYSASPANATGVPAAGLAHSALAHTDAADSALAPSDLADSGQAHSHPANADTANPDLARDACQDSFGQDYIFRVATAGARTIAAPSGPIAQSPAAARPQSNSVPRPTATPETNQAASQAVGSAAGVIRGRVLSGEQSNTSIVYEADGVEKPTIVKLFRVFLPGTNPDVELTAALSASGTVPHQYGAAALVTSTGQRADVLVAQEYLATGRDGWKLFTARLAQAAAPANLTEPTDLTELTELIRQLGTLTATFHRQLARTLGTTPATAGAIRAQRESWDNRARRALQDAPALARYRAQIAAVFDAGERATWPALQRVHGDYHLGQVLYVPGRGWVALDFEGEPLRPLAERQEVDTPLRDVAGMLRSFGYAAGQVAREGGDQQMLERWEATATETFLAGYGQIPQDQRPLLSALLLDKALYEVSYEMAQRPDWVDIPLNGVAQALKLSENRG
ncbi:Maltokinase [Actinobaculum suis]|uniref:Maltokinase n=1 Tax=Actinobaculum suis TaxID=1657 RepID=A0A7Z9CA80_9ACTO|nr:phosphotransferase [Actinobaculum suis]VDG77007.1 Maltokinase [Actinobaculum suis]